MTAASRGLVRLHLSVLLFGAAGLFGRSVLARPLAVACVRSLIASAVLCGFLLLNGRARELIATWNGPAPLLAASGLLLAVHWWTFFASIQASSVALGLITFASYPLFTSLLGWLILRERLTAATVIAVVAVVVGLVIGVPEWTVGSNSGRGAADGLVSGLTFAGLTLINRRLTRTLPAVNLVALQTGLAGLLLLPFAFRTLGVVSAPDWGTLVVLGIIFTALAHLFFTAALRDVRVATISVTTALEPVYGTVLAWLLLGERPTVRMISGGVLIVSAAILSAIAGRAQVFTSRLNRADFGSSPPPT